LNVGMSQLELVNKQVWVQNKLIMIIETC